MSPLLTRLLDNGDSDRLDAADLSSFARVASVSDWCALFDAFELEGPDIHPDSALLAQSYREAPLSVESRTLVERAQAVAARPLFQMPRHMVRWHSENRFDADPDELRAWLLELEGPWGSDRDLFEQVAWLAGKLRQAVHIAWKSYHLIETLPWLRRLLDLCPDDADSHFYLGQLTQDETADVATARASFEMYLRLRPHVLPLNQFQLDVWYVDRDGYHPGSLEAMERLGQIALAGADHESARRWFEAAIELAPDHHQAPCVALAEMLCQSPYERKRALELFIRAEANLKRAGLLSDPPRDVDANRPELHRWWKRKYPLYTDDLQADSRLGLRRLAQSYEELACSYYLGSPSPGAGEFTARWERRQSTRWAARVLDRALRLHVRSRRGLYFKTLDPHPVAAWYAELADRCYRDRHDAPFVLALLRRATLATSGFITRGLKSIWLRQARLALDVLQDRWQAEILCSRVLAHDPGNSEAREIRAEIKRHPPAGRVGSRR